MLHPRKNSIKTAISLLFIVMLALSPFTMNVSAASFKDVSKDRWSYDHIQSLVELNVINGFPDGTYRPEVNLTRAQGAIIIGRALDVNTNQPRQHTFSDVTRSTVGYEYIHALTNMGIFDKAEKFNPKNPLTRAQMAKVLVHAFDLSGQSYKHFTDVPQNHWAYDDVQTLVATGITTGTSQNTFSPNKAVTREQMAAFIHRTLDYRDGNLTPPEEPPVQEPDEQNEYSQMAVDILNLTNEERRKAGLSALKMHAETQELAMIKAKDFYINSYFDHTSPVYGSPFDMMNDAGLEYRTAGENIAAGYPSAEAVVNGWMNSPGHRANILNPAYTHLGVGYFKTDGGYSTYYVQMFITPW